MNPGTRLNYVFTRREREILFVDRREYVPTDVLQHPITVSNNGIQLTSRACFHPYLFVLLSFGVVVDGPEYIE